MVRRYEAGLAVVRYGVARCSRARRDVVRRYKVRHAQAWWSKARCGTAVQARARREVAKRGQDG